VATERGQRLPLDLPLFPSAEDECCAEGSDLAIIAIGRAVTESLAAAQILAEEGLSVRVIDARFVKPLDRELLVETASSCRRLLTVEENVLMGGFGSAVLELLADESLGSLQVCRLGVRDVFVEHATVEEQQQAHAVDRDGIIQVARKMMAHDSLQS